MNILNVRAVAGTLFVTVTLALTSTAGAVTISLTPYNAAAASLELSVDVTVDDGIAVFEFSNDSSGESAGAVMARVYFETGFAELDITDPTVVGGAGTDFAVNFPGPASPPAGNTVEWVGEFASFGAGAPPPVNGLNVGETLAISFAYSGSLHSLVMAITDVDGHARIAAHVLDCVGGNSCAVGTTAVVPVPAALPLLLSALAGLGFARRRRA